MDGASLDYGLGHCPIEFGIGFGTVYPDLGGLLGHGGLGARPDDVVDAEIIGVDSFGACVQVHDGRETWLVYTEIIQPGAVLTEFIAVVLVLCRGVNIAKKNGNSLLAIEEAPQFGAAGGVGFFTEHSAQRYKKFTRLCYLCIYYEKTLIPLYTDGPDGHPFRSSGSIPSQGK